MEYQHITLDERKAILIDRLRQYEAEHFNHSVNRDLVGHLEGEAATAAVRQASEALTVIEQAHATTLRRLRELEAEEDSPLKKPEGQENAPKRAGGRKRAN